MQKAALSYDGHQYAIYGYDRTNTREYLKARFFINTAWCETLGMDEPTTLDEMYEYLKAVKEGDPNGNGVADEIPMGGSYSYDPYSLLTLPLTAYGYTLSYGNNSIYVDVTDDGEVFFVPTAEHFKDALAWLKKLYDEELLDPEYFTQTADQVNAKQAQGIVGAFIIFRNFITGSAVQINDMFGNPKITNRFIDSSFLASVYQKLRTRTGNPANIMTFSYLKKEGFVCHS